MRVFTLFDSWSRTNGPTTGPTAESTDGRTKALIELRVRNKNGTDGPTDGLTDRQGKVYSRVSATKNEFAAAAFTIPAINGPLQICFYLIAATCYREKNIYR